MKKLQETSGFSIWLLPDEQASKKLSSLISRLAHQLSSPTFIPHITLSSVPESAQTGRLKNVLDTFSSRNHSINVYTKEAICGDPPFQRLYLPVEKSEHLLAFSESIDSQLGDDFARKGNFHASIYYGFSSCGKICSSYQEADSEVPDKLHIQSVALADINGLPNRWKIVHRKDLLR